MNKPKLELADIFRKHIGDYRKQYRMSKDQYEVVYDILSCRTAYLGGHVEKCDHCGLERPAYNSCRNRSAGGPQMPEPDQGKMASSAQARTVTGDLFSQRLYAAPRAQCCNFGQQKVDADLSF